LGWCFEILLVQAHMRFNLVMPANVFGDCGDLGAANHLVFEDSIEPFQFPVRLRVVDTAENVLDTLLG